MGDGEVKGAVKLVSRITEKACDPNELIFEAEIR